MKGPEELRLPPPPRGPRFGALASDIGNQSPTLYTYTSYGHRQARRVEQALPEAPAPPLTLYRTYAVRIAGVAGRVRAGRLSRKQRMLV